MLKKENNKLLVAYKKIGQTPLEVIKEIKNKSNSLQDIKIGYAGRLDPMAEGLLLLLLGEENKQKKKYEGLDKTYEIEILFGFATDTYDILGRMVENKNDFVFDFEKAKDALKSIVGKFEQTYPPYSSKTVDGKPLYYYARRNLLSKIKIPTRNVEIFEIKNVEKSLIKGSELLGLINKRINLVNGDFRQNEILKQWNEKIDTKKEYPVVSLTAKCSSGTYMRTLANNLGQKLGLPSLALSIKRTQIGDFKLNS